ncbi:MAG: UDP-N-acetylmuramoyl-L-alanine--D-glutamate ligase [Myxococcales bacterium]|nr:UDP-N-acetylmuramoyl-L-alanine--D-glutamate ligase [Myxococcales bacterium]
MKLDGRHTLVIGLGKSGVAAAALLRSRGAAVITADDQARADRKVVPEALSGVDLVVVSPGVPLSLPIFGEARRRGIELVGEVELASRFIEEPIVGITGTNGKSTTTALCGHLLSTAGLRVFVGGNLGNALSNRVLAGGKLDATVCELSSYQLESIVTLRCAAATVLNVTPDHLDRYDSLDSYAAAKERIFLNQRAGDAAVLNARDARVAAMRTREGVKRVMFDPRTALGDLKLSLRAATLRGAHNAENSSAACLLARHLGVTDLQRGLDTYPGLPHRLEPVRVIDGVEWINDSKATNVDSVEKSLSAFESGVIIIMGGRGKGAPYTALKPLLQAKAKAILTIGEDAEKIAAELGPVQPCGTLPNAVSKAREIARKGDVVLLSPACASYDQFRNFEDRGDQFKALVRGLR